MSEKMISKNPEHIACEICLKEVPVDEAKNFEGADYVMHFCGLECFEKWRLKEQQDSKEDN